MDLNKNEKYQRLKRAESELERVERRVAELKVGVRSLGNRLKSEQTELQMAESHVDGWKKEIAKLLGGAKDSKQVECKEYTTECRRCHVIVPVSESEYHDSWEELCKPCYKTIVNKK